MSSTLPGQFGDRYGLLIRSDLSSVAVDIIFIAAVGFDAPLPRRSRACATWARERHRAFDA
jgi:hypothetical protein